jgi:SAM-dependent methyltransferase
MAAHMHPAWHADTYDRQAPAYGTGREAYLWGFGRQLAALAAPGRGAWALDLAAGTGAVSVPLARAGARVVALDLSAPMLAALPGGTPPGAGGPIWRVRGSAQAPPLRAGAVDVLTCGFGIAFFPDLPAALAECRRVLRPAGRLALSWWRYRAGGPGTEVWRLTAERSPYARGTWEQARSLAVPNRVRDLVRRAGFPTAHVVRLQSYPLDLGTFDAWWEEWVRRWAGLRLALSAAEAPALRARLEGAVASWIGPDRALRGRAEAFAVVAGGEP